jgi:hypothetical protein
LVVGNPVSLDGDEQQVPTVRVDLARLRWPQRTRLWRGRRGCEARHKLVDLEHDHYHYLDLKHLSKLATIGKNVYIYIYIWITNVTSNIQRDSTCDLSTESTDGRTSFELQEELPVLRGGQFGMAWPFRVRLPLGTGARNLAASARGRGTVCKALLQLVYRKYQPR